MAPSVPLLAVALAGAGAAVLAGAAYALERRRHARLFDLVSRAKEQWEATFDAISDGIALVDGTGTIRRANAAFAQLVDRPITAVVGQGVSPALFGEPDALGPFLRFAVAGRRPAPEIRRSDALQRMLRIAAAPVSPPVDGASVVVVVEDISEQQALQAQLIQSEKMAAVGTLVSGVAHELNNPLTSIAGLSELLLERAAAAPSPESRDHLRVINEEAERAGRIVRDLLTFARKGPAERQPVDLADVVRRTVLLAGYELRRRGIDVEAALAPALPPVLGDRHQLQQIVLNLVTNAAQAMTRLPPEAPKHVSITTAAEGGRVVLKVTDTGPGLTEEVRQRMFSPFFTTKAPGEGTGLGLFVSYGIAEAHGGSLTAEPATRGATLVLALPAMRDGWEAAPGPVDERPAVPAAARRILVVDDDPVVRQVVAALFARDGHQVDATADPADALRLAQLERYDLVIADRLAAPGGEPLAAAMARLPGGLSRRLVLSTSDAHAEATADGPPLLRKPFDLRELRKVADEVFQAAR